MDVYICLHIYTRIRIIHVFTYVNIWIYIQVMPIVLRAMTSHFVPANHALHLYMYIFLCEYIYLYIILTYIYTYPYNVCVYIYIYIHTHRWCWQYWKQCRSSSCQQMTRHVYRDTCMYMYEYVYVYTYLHIRTRYV